MTGGTLRRPLEISEEAHVKLRRLAAQQGRTMGAIAEQLIHDELERVRYHKGPKPEPLGDDETTQVVHQ